MYKLLINVRIVIVYIPLFYIVILVDWLFPQQIYFKEQLLDSANSTKLVNCFIFHNITEMHNYEKSKGYSMLKAAMKGEMKKSFFKC
jgi:hypothetical protein